MANKTRKVSFYRLSLEKHVAVPKQRRPRVTPLTNDEIESCFQKIYDEQMKKLTDDHRAIDIAVFGNQYVIEVIQFEERRAFIKIGQQNPSYTVALRDSTTLETEGVPMKETQLLELFTFCLVDFETGIISYIGINGAPRISAIRALFDQCLIEKEGIHAVLAAIMTDDILQVVMRKKTISKLSVVVSVPDDKILSDIGVSAENFDAVRNVKTHTATYTLTAKRNASIFSSGRSLAEVVASTKSKFGDDLKKLLANAKDDGEGSQPYDLLQYSFTKTVVFNHEDAAFLTFEDFQAALVNVYTQNKHELIRYSRR
ncbi:hypothetical protein [Acutalibacter muris]|uniref:hypothetical protein n=1 Tax=Acutalibacter muris TaxID=1796620 RepID=UPI00272EDB26|nr:hypothetical protein [Acutalibacter muris]